VTGEGLSGGVVFWDAGLGSERKLPAAVQGATMFSVPSGSSVGSHPVAIESASGRSAPVEFVVAGAKPIATPRLDDVSLADTAFDEGGNVRVVLYVQGANIDVGAKVMVDGIETPSSAHRTIRNNLFGADPKALGYPIRHYLSRVVPLAPRSRGGSIAVKVVNEGGESSKEMTYQLPEDRKTFSSAGDGIPDDAKLNGYDNGNGRIDLKALGADPYRKIIFVQVDIMDGAIPPVAGTFGKVREMFANAPILNPYSPSGIDLVIDSTGLVPRRDVIDFIDEDNPATETASFFKLKTAHFDLKRQKLYHYAIWGRLQPTQNVSGCSNVDFNGTKVGDSFMITMYDLGSGFQTLRSHAETFAHELGHDLGQKHGGTSHLQYKPNYWSVMSYSWQLRSSQPARMRLLYPTCTQIYYGMPGAIERHGQMPNVQHLRIDYSDGMGPTLVENNHSLNEGLGVCGQPIDWNRAAPIDPQGEEGGRVEDIANWPNLRYNGPKLGGNHNPC
jgi:hypothetical protein